MTLMAKTKPRFVPCYRLNPCADVGVFLQCQLHEVALKTAFLTVFEVKR